MLDMARTRFGTTIDSKIAGSANAIREGMALAITLDNGEGGVRPTAASNNDAFYGVAYSELMIVDTFVAVETYKVPAGGGAITLKKAIKTGANPLVKIGGTVYVAADPAVAGTSYKLESDRKNLTFAAGDANKTVTVTYRHDLTVDEALRITGDGVLGAKTAAYMSGMMGVIQDGQIFTTEFDQSADWATAVDVSVVIKAGANGQFQIGGTGATVPARVIHVPTADVPFLGLDIAR